ncbi:serine hydrolase domain-containing protein [Microscilla marina]|uniref:Beta-lactamase n=1 Tax=Microscilla marina ATCC 23134 TaxID=313606 RepID=A1ZVC5_MICM2|nr:serine hydrolase domain-containing protein [Microscilla marina]EAY25623.1 beta-lactamase [Microscilla marina ATCC 23134]
MQKRFIIITTILLSIICINNLKSQTLNEWKKKVVPEFEKRVKKIPVVGASLCLVQNGKITDFKTYGYINKKEQIVNTKETIFNWASITKTLTSVAVMQLRDQGKLKLDDPVIKHLPEFRWVSTDSIGIPIEQVKIRHLITHTSGISRGKLWQYDNYYDAQDYKPTGWSQVAAILPYCKIVRKPGAKLVYSNFAYVLLGRIVENVSGDVYVNYINKNIFLPLKMYSAHFGKSPAHLANYKSWSYTKYGKDSTFKVIQPEHNRGAYNPAGGFYSNILDLVKYANFLCGVGNAQDRQNFNLVLKSKSLKEMFSPQIKIIDSQGQRLDMTLSFYSFKYNNKDILYKDGNQFGFRSYLYFDTSTNTSAIIVFNTKSKKIDQHFMRLSQYDINARFFHFYKAKKGKK